MAEVHILKAVEFDKLSSATKKRYGSVKGLRDAGWWLQRKYDGCFGMAVISATGQHRMLSRAGEDYTKSCQHILDELAACANEQSGGWDTFVVLGEVWNAGMLFKDISGRFRQQREVARELHFACNDLLPEELETTSPYAERFADLENLLAFRPVPGQLFPVDTDRTSTVDPEEVARRLVALGGYDGAILRDPAAPYTIGLAKLGEIVKVKPTLSLDLRCIELTETVGERTGRAVYTIAVEYRGVRTAVGSGMPHKFEQLPKLGQIVEIEAMGLTADGKLREPRFKGIRFDKEEPDA